MGKLGDFFNCNPQVKLERGKKYPLVDIDSISIGKKHPEPKEEIEYVGQSGSKFCSGDTIMARITPCSRHIQNCWITRFKHLEEKLNSPE